MQKKLSLNPAEVVIMTHVLKWVREGLCFNDRDDTWMFIEREKLILDFPDLRVLEDVLYKESNTEFS